MAVETSYLFLALQDVPYCIVRSRGYQGYDEEGSAEVECILFSVRSREGMVLRATLEIGNCRDEARIRDERVTGSTWIEEDFEEDVGAL
jgi:hypothetical protein